MYDVDISKMDKDLATFLEDNFLRQSMAGLLLSLTKKIDAREIFTFLWYNTMQRLK